MLKRCGSGQPSSMAVFRPIMIGFSQVSVRNRFRSLGKCQGRPVSMPITPLAATAAMRETIILCPLHGDLALERRVTLVVREPESVELDVVDAPQARVDFEPGQRKRL